MKDKLVHIHSQSLGDIPLPSFFPIETKEPSPPTPFPQEKLIDENSDLTKSVSALFLEYIGNLSELSKTAQMALDFSISAKREKREFAFKFRNHSAILLEEVKILASDFEVDKVVLPPPSSTPTNFYEAFSKAFVIGTKCICNSNSLLFLLKGKSQLAELLRLHILLKEELENISDYI